MSTIESSSVPLYLRGLVQTFSTDKALVKSITKATRMSRKQSNALAAALASLRASGVAVARLQGLALSPAPGCPAITDEEPAALAEVEADCKAIADDVPPGFVLVVIPAGVVAGGLQ